MVPDYYADFHCKMGACRAACCEGWPISLSLTDYFELLGVNCSPELRRTMDCALHVSLHPTPEAYAQISPRYDGQCPMRMADGRCAIHAELGEGALAAVCRLYPRGVRTGEVHEASCANSCEAVLELLINRREPIAFVNRNMDPGVPEAPARSYHFESAGREQEIRLWLISHIQNRAYPLPRRILLMGEALLAMDQALSQRDERRVEALLCGKESVSVPEAIRAEHDQLQFGLQATGRMLEIIDKSSDSIRTYGEAARDYFGEGEAAFEKYVQAATHFDEIFPDWECWFEHMLVNHMFFVQFPFQDRPVGFKDEFLALCAVYILLRFLCVGWMAKRADTESAIDVAAAAFRLIDHTEFDRYAAPVLKQLGCDDWLHLRQLLCL